MVNQKQVEYQRRYLAKNRDKINARRRERRQRPEVKAKEKEYTQRPEVKARRAAAARIHNKTPEAQAYQREWRRNNPEKSKEYYERNKEENQRVGRERKRNLRKQVIEMMGGKCVVCGFDDWRALQVDHINGGGVKEHQEIGSQGILRKVRANPHLIGAEYQLLCANHNWIKRYNRGENN